MRRRARCDGLYGLEGQALHTVSPEHTYQHSNRGLAARSGWTPLRAFVFLAIVASIVIAVDRCTKIFFDQFSLGEDIAGPFFGLFQFTLVHNTGGAWGIFSDSTMLLAVFSVIVSVAIAVAVIVLARHSNWLLTLGGALIVAGGIGNAIDRFIQGYVVDFIEFSFVRFPVFNVADIGVTCGFVILVIAGVFFWKHEDAEAVKESERQ